MNTSVDYQNLVRQATLGLIKKIMQQMDKNGLVGEQHFFINFSTSSDSVVMSPRLKDQYPQEMAIIIKNWYADLEVLDDYFSITLNFGNVPENLRIPYNTIISFSDPSVNFTIKPGELNTTNDLNTFKDEIEIMGDIVEEIENKQEFGENKDKGKKGKIVDLEQFRKK